MRFRLSPAELLGFTAVAALACAALVNATAEVHTIVAATSLVAFFAALVCSLHDDRKIGAFSLGFVAGGLFHFVLIFACVNAGLTPPTLWLLDRLWDVMHFSEDQINRMGIRGELFLGVGILVATLLLALFGGWLARNACAAPPHNRRLAR